MNPTSPDEKVTITKAQLEEMVSNKLIELLTEVGDLAYARNKAEASENERENMSKKREELLKIIKDQRKVLRKFTEDKLKSKNYTKDVSPAKVMRSVGLQVCTVGHPYMSAPEPESVPSEPLPQSSSQSGQPSAPQPQPPIKQLAKRTDPVKNALADAKKEQGVHSTASKECTEEQQPQLPFPPVAAPQYPPKTVLPPKPILFGRKKVNLIMLMWNFSEKEATPISKFQVYSYQEGSDSGKDSWWKVGEVEPLQLPMACSLVKFKEGYKYYFSIRAVDKNSIKGPFSEPASVNFFPKKL